MLLLGVHNRPQGLARRSVKYGKTLEFVVADCSAHGLK